MMLNKTKKTEGSRTVKKEKTREPEVKVTPVAKETEVTKKAPTVTKVGALLKNMRLEKGLKVIDVAKRLCIRKQYLEAIEDSNYSEIPAFPYGVGFVRSYADFLGLNSSNVVELYKEETNIVKGSEIVVEEPQKKSAMPSGIYLLISLIAIAALYGGWVMLNSNESSQDVNIEEQIDEADDVVAVEELTISQDINTNSADTASVKDDNQIVVSEESYSPANLTENTSTSTEVVAESKISPIGNNEVKTENAIPSQGVYIEVLEETWIEVKNEQKLYLSKVLKSGENYLLPNDKELMLSVGKRGSVNVYVNGVKTDIARSGKQMHIDVDSYLAGNH